MTMTKVGRVRENKMRENLYCAKYKKIFENRLKIRKFAKKIAKNGLKIRKCGWVRENKVRELLYCAKMMMREL